MGYKSWIGIVAVLILLGGAYFWIQRAPAPQDEQPNEIQVMHLDKMTQANLRKYWPALVASAAHPALGDAKAPWTLIEIGDFQCPMCGRLHTDVEQLVTDSKGQLKMYFVNWPLPMHPHALRAATASVAAARQAKFWPMYDAIYGNRDALEGVSAPKAETVLQQDAAQAKLDPARFQKDMADPTIVVALKKQTDLIVSLGAASTPTFLLRKSGSQDVYFFVGQGGQEQTTTTPLYPGLNDLIDEAPWRGGQLDPPAESPNAGGGQQAPSGAPAATSSDTLGNSISGTHHS